ncbi:Ricin B lectin [Catenulispora acidiphila DSM 44928]|uniref:Ricin B lectin n=2 Tax=Catenulispora TaxID=414878 RepID=C7Q922_CATAD|nr:Ricin B lectin [Catenulispora acidiphila DSM 44928]
MRMRRKIAAIGVSMAAAVSAVVVSSGSASAAPFPFQEIGVFNSSHCLDNATEIDSVLQMWSCTGGDEQQWAEEFDTNTSTYYFVNLNTHRCITAPPAQGRVDMEPCPLNSPPNSQSQEWTIFDHASDNSWIAWQNKASHLCLDTPSVGNGTVLEAEPCNVAISYQKFTERGR